MRKKVAEKLPFSVRDTAVTLLILSFAMLSCLLLMGKTESTSHVTLLFVLAVFLISRLTDGYLYGIIASMVSVFGVNYVFTYPYMELDFSLAGYPLTFITMLFVAVTTSMMTSQLKAQEKLKAEAQREKMRGNLLRAVSHDLRTPLTSIIGAAEMLENTFAFIEDGESQNLASGIRKDADWLLRMVENMLSVTRLESGAQLNLQEELPEEIIGSAAAKFKKWHPDHKLTVIFPREVLMAKMDGVLIEQVILNFLDNAARHSGSEQPIELECGREGQNLFIRVTDHGCGLDEAEQEKIFNSRLKKSNGDGRRGMGIGLSVCRTIIKAHNGTVTARNHPAGGAVFQFILPLTEVEHEQ